MDFKEFNNMEDKKFIIFNGRKYCRMGGKRKYFLSYTTKNLQRKNPKGLHVAIWEYVHNQEVPKGYVVHHIDGNTFNNNPQNLECISLREHLELHKESRISYGKSEAGKKHLEEIRELASKWHKSEEGREWHKEHAKKNMELKREKRICQICGQEFEYCKVKKRENWAYDGRWCKRCFNREWARLYRRLQRGEITRLQFKSIWRSIFCK